MNPNELLWEIARGLPGELLRIVVTNPLAWLGVLAMVGLVVIIGRYERRGRRRRR